MIKPSTSTANQEATSHSNNIGVCSKAILVITIGLQNALAAILGRYTRANPNQEVILFNVRNFVMLTEVVKLLGFLVAESIYSEGELLSGLNEYIFKTPFQSLKYLLPAAFYFIQSTLAYFALTYMDAQLFLVIFQSRIVTTALLSSIIVGRQHTWAQWFCLFTLSLGVATAVVGGLATQQPGDSVFLGLMCTLTACLSTSTASAYFEIFFSDTSLENSSSTLLNPTPPSIWIQNIQLSFYSILIAITLGLSKTEIVRGWNEGEIKNDVTNFFQGFTPMVWMLLVVQAMGGLFVAGVISYLDNSLKGLATIISIVAVVGINSILFQPDLTPHFIVGALYVVLSVYFFGNALPTCFQIGVKPEEQTSKEGGGGGGGERQRRMSVLEMAIMAHKQRRNTGDSTDGLAMGSNARPSRLFRKLSAAFVGFSIHDLSFVSDGSLPSHESKSHGSRSSFG